MTVFRQYTRTGESIQEMEMTPEKMKVEELMGRAVNTDADAASSS